jgi:hypothetical protein
MDAAIRGLVDGLLVPAINVIVVPVASSVPVLASSGALLALFMLLWGAFGIALLRRRSSLDAAWTRIRALPLPVEGVVWLLFLPVLAGLWIWRTSWPLVARLAIIGGVAGWNLLVFIPRPA